LDQAHTIAERLTSAQPGLVAHRLQLSRIVLNIAKIKGRQGKLDEAITSIERVLEIESQVVADYPELLEPRIELASAHAILGDYLRQKPAELFTAIESYQKAVELHEALARQHPELVDQSYQLASEFSKLGGIQEELGQLEPALHYLRRTMEIFERLTESYTDVVLYRDGLGTTYNTMSELERKRGDKSEALDFAQKARKLFEQLVSDNPNNASYRRNLAQSFTSLGRLQTQTADSALALRSFQHAVDLLESLHELNAKDSYKLACNIALCISLITRNSMSQSTPQQLSKGDRLRCQLYGDRAIESLRRSFNGGFLSSQVLEDETDLDSLRSRADFKALVKEIEEAPVHSGQKDR
jgi:tetratricopeptide (TPR) repeat protein